MNKIAFITTLHTLNADLRVAIADGDFDEVRRIDESRQDLLHRLAAEEALEAMEAELLASESA